MPDRLHHEERRAVKFGAGMLAATSPLPSAMTKKNPTDTREVDQREYEDQHYGILVERLLEQDYSEDEVVRAVEQAQAELRRVA
jgi:predicted component of type VI protein secretion system